MNKEQSLAPILLGLLKIRQHLLFASINGNRAVARHFKVYIIHLKK